jgi:hypothetical protein
VNLGDTLYISLLVAETSEGDAPAKPSTTRYYCQLISSVRFLNADIDSLMGTLRQIVADIITELGFSYTSFINTPPRIISERVLFETTISYTRLAMDKRLACSIKTYLKIKVSILDKCIEF